MNRNWFIDACVIIYFMEANGDRGETLRNRISTHLQKDGIIAVSRLSCLECRVLPLRRGDSVLTACYSQFFALPHLRIIELTPEVLEIATELRVHYSLRTPDALQAACSLADMTSPADNPWAPTPQHVANDSFLSKLGIPTDLRIARGATLRDTRDGGSKPSSATSNDNLANATIITALPYTSTVDASLTSQSLETNEILPSCNASGSMGYGTVWYQYTPTHDHTVVITAYSKNLSVWTGISHPLTELACGSSGELWNGSSRLALDLTAGTTYYINTRNQNSNYFGSL